MSTQLSTEQKQYVQKDPCVRRYTRAALKQSAVHTRAWPTVFSTFSGPLLESTRRTGGVLSFLKPVGEQISLAAEIKCFFARPSPLLFPLWLPSCTFDIGFAHELGFHSMGCPPSASHVELAMPTFRLDRTGSAPRRGSHHLRIRGKWWKGGQDRGLQFINP